MPDRPFAQLIRREGTASGWLAVPPPGARFQVGVEGTTANDALQRWVSAWSRWEADAERIAEMKASGEWDLPRHMWSKP